MFRHGHFFFNSIFHEILVLLHSDYREETKCSFRVSDFVKISNISASLLNSCHFKSKKSIYSGPLLALFCSFVNIRDATRYRSHKNYPNPPAFRGAGKTA